MSGPPRRPSRHRRLTLERWLYPGQVDAEVLVWPINDGVDIHPEMAGRMSVTIKSGCSSLDLRPTREEALALAALLLQAADGLSAAEAPAPSVLPPCAEATP